MSYELSGTVIRVGNVEQKSEKLTICEVVVETARDVKGTKYTEQIPCQFKNAAVDKAAALKVGNEVKVKFDIGGREWNGRYFCSVNAWAVDVIGAAAPQEVGGKYDNTQLPF